MRREGRVGEVSGVWMWMWVWLGVRREGSGCGCGWGSVWGAPVSIWGADGSEVLFFSQAGLKSYVLAGGKKFEWKWVTGQWVFVAMLDALGVTPV